MDYGYSGVYSTTTYGAQGGAGGGGFVTGGSQASPSVNKTYRDDSLRPVTIKQLNEAEQMGEKDFKIDKAQISQCTLVAQVQNISQQTTNITYKLDDGTGTIEVKVWNDRDNNDENLERNITENSYVRAWGRLHSMGSKRYVGAHVIRPIADYNEINYHLLEATVVHLYFTYGPPSGAKAGADNVNGQRDAHMSNLPVGLSAIETKVYRCLETAPNVNDGLHEQDIASKLGMDVGEVSTVCLELERKGSVFSTVDDSTWTFTRPA